VRGSAVFVRMALLYLCYCSDVERRLLQGFGSILSPDDAFFGENSQNIVKRAIVIGPTVKGARQVLEQGC